MESLELLISSLVLTLVLPVSVGVLYLVIARHTQICAAAAMDSAIVARFDSVDELTAFHDDVNAAQEARLTAAQARFVSRRDAVLARLDPIEASAPSGALPQGHAQARPTPPQDALAGADAAGTVRPPARTRASAQAARANGAAAP